MNSIAKILIGVGITGAVAATAYVVSQNNTKKRTIVLTSREEDGEIVAERPKDETIIDKIKAAATKKAIKILAWAAIHQQQIEAFGAILGVVGAVVSIGVSVRDFIKGNAKMKKLDLINQKLDYLYAMKCLENEATDHNNLVFATTAGFICDKIDVDSDALKTAVDAIGKTAEAVTQ